MKLKKVLRKIKRLQSQCEGGYLAMSELKNWLAKKGNDDDDEGGPPAEPPPEPPPAARVIVPGRNGHVEQLAPSVAVPELGAES